MEKFTSNNHLDEELNFDEYINVITHRWLKTLSILGFTLIPIFYLLDWVILPASARNLLPVFGLYRAASTVFIIIQFLILKNTSASRFSFIHGYLFTLNVSLIIVFMTRDMGGFNSPYYAGLNLVIVAVGLMLPWRATHSLANGMTTLSLYIVVNYLFAQGFQIELLVNNLFFMSGTIIIATSITFLKHKLIHNEFEARKQVKSARDQLWGEMELAKKIQTSLIPTRIELDGFDALGYMRPASEVGGDYFDIIQAGNRQYAVIGDVSGHGVTSGLIMMMAQTVLHSIITSERFSSPSDILSHANLTLTENIQKLGEEKYMTMKLLELHPSGKIKFTGAHLNSIIFRSKTGTTEYLESKGFWLGMEEKIKDFLIEGEITLSNNDVILLYTDGLTESVDPQNNLFGLEYLSEILKNNGQKDIGFIQSAILEALEKYEINDDISILILKKQKESNSKMDNKLNLNISPLWGKIPEITSKIESNMKEFSQGQIDFTIMAATELLENAIKYGIPNHNQDKIGFEFNLQNDSINIIVKSGINSEDKNFIQFTRIIDKINSTEQVNRKLLYIQRIMEIMENPAVPGSYLGLYRIVSEGDFDLNYNIINGNILEIAANKRVRKVAY